MFNDSILQIMYQLIACTFVMPSYFIGEAFSSRWPLSHDHRYIDRSFFCFYGPTVFEYRRPVHGTAAQIMSVFHEALPVAPVSTRRSESRHFDTLQTPLSAIRARCYFRYCFGSGAFLLENGKGSLQ